ncbi:glycoside hydrolase family 17 protein [Aliarcobacter cibarius]|uniref:Endo-1,3-beta-glucanase btgC n=1 Tax=Aliarcobacter cibarius TaxID=255507 RepID=A0A7L5JRI1_9BACT|nr:glycosyl hydrolase family 17 protein [Aliarcobacter cibarius]QKJ27706.1 putative glycosyl hydrolase [Aliarcobacter cibarius]TLT05029.1 glycosyl hydrolase [Aliarcobacter cibarius]
MTTRLFLTFLSSLAIMFFWLFLGEKAILKDDSNKFSKLQCVSYAPFGKDESPFLFDKGLVLKEENIKKDLELLSKYTSCIRTYSTVGLEAIPKYAKEYNLQMLMGVWVSKSEKQSRDEIETLKKLASQYPEVIKSVIVGNEVLLRGDLSEKKLTEYILEVKQALPNIRVTYADVWEFWLKHPNMKNVTDFVTIHILPYWEDLPMSIEKSINHLADVRVKVEKELGTSNILIGETGWPSEGRAREDAVPSRINQAKYVRDFVNLANERNWNYNIIEAFDQPWKRVSEGAVGGYWGLFDADRADKNVFAGDVSNFPNYLYLAFVSLGLALAFSTMLRKKKLSKTRIIAFSIVNTIFALLLTLQIEQYYVISRNYLEASWAIIVVGLCLYMYNFVLVKILQTTKDDFIPKYPFYLAAFLVFIISTNLAYNGRYENFEIYGFALLAISFIYTLVGRFKELHFGLFEKLLGTTIFINAVVTLYNETILNVFSNIWFIITLVFASILIISKESIFKAKEYIFFAIIFTTLIALFKSGFISNNELAIACNNDGSGLSCTLRSSMWSYIYFGYLGVLALIFGILSLILNNKRFTILGLFIAIFSIILTNTFLGSIAFMLVIYSISKQIYKK